MHSVCVVVFAETMGQGQEANYDAVSVLGSEVVRVTNVGLEGGRRRNGEGPQPFSSGDDWGWERQDSEKPGLGQKPQTLFPDLTRSPI